MRHSRWETSPQPTRNYNNKTADCQTAGRLTYWSLSTVPILLFLHLFNKVYYVTTFTADGGQGTARLYALSYKTGAPALFTENGNDTWSKIVGVGVPSKPIMYIGRTKLRLFASTATSLVGGPGPGPATSAEAAILEIQPLAPSSNLFYLWWIIL